mmetsp:Transcript_70273/g.131421  ORF Transcript_70273/g.131421 Transcript_70273/m.131421 type:complete len:213 (+) Transcript_70273:381-1019(+)
MRSHRQHHPALLLELLLPLLGPAGCPQCPPVRQEKHLHPHHPQPPAKQAHCHWLPLLGAPDLWQCPRHRHPFSEQKVSFLLQKHLLAPQLSRPLLLHLLHPPLQQLPLPPQLEQLPLRHPQFRVPLLMWQPLLLRVDPAQASLAHHTPLLEPLPPLPPALLLGLLLLLPLWHHSLAVTPQPLPRRRCLPLSLLILLQSPSCQSEWRRPHPLR